MAKCRMLIAENQELGKQLSQGRIAKLEAELALQKKYNEELKSSQDGMLFYAKSPLISYISCLLVLIKRQNLIILTNGRWAHSIHSRSIK